MVPSLSHPSRTPSFLLILRSWVQIEETGSLVIDRSAEIMIDRKCQKLPCRNRKKILVLKLARGLYSEVKNIRTFTNDVNLETERRLVENIDSILRLLVELLKLVSLLGYHQKP